MGIEFTRLPAVDSADLIALMSSPVVRRRLPRSPLGEVLHREILRRAVATLDPESVTALLPATRGGARALLRLGRAAEIGGHRFTRYRLRPPKVLTTHKGGHRSTSHSWGLPRSGNR